MPFLASDSFTSWAKVSINVPFSRPIRDDTAHILGKRLFLHQTLCLSNSPDCFLGGGPDARSLDQGNTVTSFSQSFHSQWGGSLCKLLWARGHLGRASASLIANPSVLAADFLTPVGGKSTPACSGCQGNITTYCIPCRDGPNGPYDHSTSTGNSHAFNTLLSAGLAAQGFG